MLDDTTYAKTDAIGLTAKERKAVYRKKWKKTAAGKESKAKSDKKWRLANLDKCRMYDVLSSPGKSESRRKTKDHRQAWLHGLKQKLACSECGFDQHPAALQFHHVDSSTKMAGVSRLLHRVGASFEDILEEITKCMVLCANCHAIHHYKEHQERKNSV